MFNDGKWTTRIKAELLKKQQEAEQRRKEEAAQKQRERELREQREKVRARLESFWV